MVTLRRSPITLSFPVARISSGLMLVGFLFCSYRVVRTEIESHRQWSPLTTPNVLQARETPASKVQTTTIHQVSPKAQPRDAERLRVKPTQREGSRREWYEKRKRRWFTPPDPKLDKGLPKVRGRFKVA